MRRPHVADDYQNLPAILTQRETPSGRLCAQGAACQYWCWYRYCTGWGWPNWRYRPGNGVDLALDFRSTYDIAHLAGMFVIATRESRGRQFSGGERELSDAH